MLLGWILGLMSLVAAPDAEAKAAPAAEAKAKAERGPGAWRFEDESKPVKVVVLAGSVGAWRSDPYHGQLADRCSAIEVKNISKVGMGAYPMKQHFKNQVVRNRRLTLDDGNEYWVIVASGVNSIGMPEATNHYLKSIFLHAHLQKMKVVALTPTPWGDLSDRRWRGTEGLGRRKATQLVVDFLTGKLEPLQAFGAHASKRPAGERGPWNPIELPDVAIDLYDSPLRDEDAKARERGAMTTLLEKDSGWKRAHRDLSDEARKAALAADGALLAGIPQWFLREELRAFDHTHPNKAGHTVIAQTMCPQLPPSWKCACD